MFLNILEHLFNWYNIMLKGIKLLSVMFYVGLGSFGFAQGDFIDLTRDFYLRLNEGDSVTLKKMLHRNASVTHVGADTSFTFSAIEFLDVCPQFKSKVFQEKIHSIIALEVTPQIVTVQVEYRFFYQGKYSHCGIDHFTWIVKEGEALIETILSSDNVACGDDIVEQPLIISNEEKELNRLLNKWHKDVASLQLEAYFGLMTEDFVFLGTDPSERWNKVEFLGFCRPYFEERKSTWNFTPLNRFWNFSEDGKTAWFDESLSTQMDECRGSGVFVRTDSGWRIAHYNLTVLIENEKMDKFLKLRKK
jgi:ketosteroid isomerase-like protein